MSRRISRTAQQLLEQLMTVLGPTVQVLHAGEREWASITFSGARHHFVLRVPAATYEQRTFQQAVAALPEHEFSLRGEIVADCTVTPDNSSTTSAPEDQRLLIVEMLTINGD